MKKSTQKLLIGAALGIAALYIARGSGRASGINSSVEFFNPQLSPDPTDSWFVRANNGMAQRLYGGGEYQGGDIQYPTGG